MVVGVDLGGGAAGGVDLREGAAAAAPHPHVSFDSTN